MLPSASMERQNTRQNPAVEKRTNQNCNFLAGCSENRSEMTMTRSSNRNSLPTARVLVEFSLRFMDFCECLWGFGKAGEEKSAQTSRANTSAHHVADRGTGGRSVLHMKARKVAWSPGGRGI